MNSPASPLTRYENLEDTPNARCVLASLLLLVSDVNLLLTEVK